MTPEEFLEIIVAQKIRLMPRYDCVRGKIRYVGWSAGRVTLCRQGVYTQPDQFAFGATPIEAVANLLAGKTEFKSMTHP